jgi:Metallo-peptidase family M12B Reprolysin-like
MASAEPNRGRRAPLRSLTGLLFFVAVLSWPSSTSITSAQPACDIIWDGGGLNNLWQNRFNWEPDVLPSGRVCIGAGSSVVLSDGGFHTIAKLTSDSPLTITSLSTLQISSASAINNNLTLDSGAQLNHSGLTVGGLFTWGGLLYGFGTPPSTLDAKGGISITGTTRPSELMRGSVINRQTATMSLSSRLRLDHSFFPGEAATFENLQGATFEIGNGLGLEAGGNGTGASFNNSGILAKSLSGSSSFTGFVPLNNTGSVLATLGTLRIETGTSAGLFEVAGGATLEFGFNGTFDILPGSVIRGAGRVRILNGTIMNLSADIMAQQVSNEFAHVNLGGERGTRVINITGNYTQSGGSLHVEIGGTGAGQFDRLNISGQANLNGWLEIVRSEGFNPAVGDSFRIMTFGSRSGNFLPITGLDLPGGKRFDVNVGLNDIVLTVKAKATDLRITEVRPVQVVYGATLVAGKATAVKVVVEVADPEAVPDEGVKLDVVFGERPAERITITKQELSTGSVVKFVNPTVRFRPLAGSLLIIATVDSDDLVGESDETNNRAAFQTENVESKQLLTVAFFPVDGCRGSTFCYNGPNAPTQTMNGGAQYVLGTFPTAFIDFRAYPTTPYLGVRRFDPGPGQRDAMSLDLEALARRAQRLRVKRAIGIVNSGYFTHHNRSALGLAQMYGKSAVVQDNWLSTVAHELGHTFGLDHNNGTSDTTGFWVEGNQAITNANNYMAAKSTSALGASGLWITPGDYNQLSGGLGAGQDPEVLLVALNISKAGEIDVPFWYFDSQGEVFSAQEGTHGIRVLDAQRNVLSIVPFTPSFVRFVGDDREELEWASAILSVPYPKTAALIEIFKETLTLKTIIPQTKLLKDAISSLPVAAFLDNPDLRRGQLVTQIDATEQSLQINDYVSAKKGFGTLADLVRQWIKPDYPVDDILQVAAPELAVLQDDTIKRIDDFLSQAPLKCDANGDGVIDQADLLIIRNANGQAASGVNDARDGNGDLAINVADVRYCQLRQTPK